MAAAEPPAGVALASASASVQAANESSGPITQGLQEPLVDRPVSGNHRSMPDAELAPLVVGDQTARLADEQRAGRDVPGGEVLLPESLESPRRDIGQVDGSGAGSADAGGPGGDAGELALVLGHPGQ